MKSDIMFFSLSIADWIKQLFSQTLNQHNQKVEVLMKVVLSLSIYHSFSQNSPVYESVLSCALLLTLDYVSFFMTVVEVNLTSPSLKNKQTRFNEHFCMAFVTAVLL